MAINLDNYEPVEERLMRFKKEYPNFRMKSDLLSMDGEIGKTRWVVMVSLYKDFDDEKPVSTGLAFEIDGVGMAQRAAALETCETSALGRALANIGFVGSRRVTREEMEKVSRHEAYEALKQAVHTAGDIPSLQGLWQSVSTLCETDPVRVLYMQRVREFQAQAGT